MSEKEREKLKVTVKPVPRVLPRKELTLEERVARLEKLRFGEVKPYA